jgi:putative hemolysin
MNILRNKFLYIGVPVLVLVIAIIFVLNGNVAKSPEEEIPLPPPQENIVNFEGKILSTPSGSQFNDYFIASDGQEYGIEAINNKKDLQDQIASFRDSGKTILIEGNLVTDVIDYGTRQIQVKSIKEKTEVAVGTPNPASVYCARQGGKLEIKDTPQGQIGMCVTDKGECEEWAYFRGECDPKDGNIVLKNCDEFRGAGACIQIYQPVCARIFEQSDQAMPEWRTFSNNCLACNTTETISIVGYKEGTCE